MTDLTNNYRYRLEQLEKAVDRLEGIGIQTELALIKRELTSIHSDVVNKHNEAMDETRSLRKAFRNFAFSVIGGLIVGAVAMATQL